MHKIIAKLGLMCLQISVIMNVIMLIEVKLYHQGHVLNLLNTNATV